MPIKDLEARRAYNREWVAKRRYEFFFDKFCVKCGSTERLELDHVNRANKITHAIWTWSKVKRESEIAKCQVLCYDCHKLKTKSELSNHPHGTRTRYSDYGCRCDLCRSAAVQAVYDWRDRVKGRKSVSKES